MKPKNILVIGPVYSMSGYGERTRCLIEDLEFLDCVVDVYPTPWGNTLQIKDKHYTEFNSDLEYDVTFIVGMLNEPPRIYVESKKTYWVTAGIETDTMYKFGYISATGLLVSSNHSKSLISPDDKNLSINEGIKVLHETVKLEPPTYNYDKRRILISGAWIGGTQSGEDRKNIPRSIEVALNLIANSSDPTDYELVVHTSMGTYSELERSQIETYIKHLKNKLNVNTTVKLIHGILTEGQLANVYGMCQWMLSLTHGEGFGRHMAEFMLSGGRLIVPNFSGHVDFAITNDNYILDVDMKRVPNSVVNSWILKDSKWAEISDETLDHLQDWFNKLPDDKWNTKSDINIKKIQKINADSLLLLKEILYT